MKDNSLIIAGIAVYGIYLLSRKGGPGESADGDTTGYSFGVKILNAPPATTHFNISFTDRVWSTVYHKQQSDQYIPITDMATFVVPDNIQMPLLVVTCQGVYEATGYAEKTWQQTFYFQSFNPQNQVYVDKAIISSFTPGQKFSLDINNGMFLS